MWVEQTGVWGFGGGLSGGGLGFVLNREGSRAVGKQARV